MPFCSKLKADCVELINGELDAIRIEKDEDFALVARELQKLIAPKKCCLVNLISFFSANQEKKPLIPTSQPLFSTGAQAQIDYIKFCLENPQEFVSSKNNYAEYKRILKERIAAKIIELQTITGPEKAAYIKFQQERYCGCFITIPIS